MVRSRLARPLSIATTGSTKQRRRGGGTAAMSTQAQELHRSISASVADMLSEYRLQAQAGPVTDKAIEELLFRASHGDALRALA